MKLSARNQLKGNVVEIVKGSVNSTVRIDIGNGNEITSMITNAAVDELQLKEGSTAYAVVKASNVIIAID